MKAIIKRPFEPVGIITDIENKLRALQIAIGGHIEPVTLRSRGVCILCDEEGRIYREPHNCRVDGVRFLGTIVVVGADSEDFADCPLTLEEWERMLS